MVYLNILWVVVTLLAYLSPYSNPKNLWPLSVIAVFYPWLLLGNVLFIIFWLFNKLRFSLISLITIIVGINYIQGFIGLNSTGYMSSPGQLEILSYNTQNLNYIYRAVDNKDERAQQFFSFMKDFEDVDFICTQELGIRSIELWNKKLKYPYMFAPEEIGPVIFSKHPIQNKGQIHSSTSTINSCIWVDVNVNGSNYRIYNLHMESNKITMTAERVIKEGNIQNRETWSGVKSIIQRYRDNASVRIGHAERIRAHMHESPYPIILAGDFNDVPLSYLYDLIKGDMQDSFVEKGRGLGTTFAGKIPALRIDYILVSDQFKVLEHQILREGFSDHYPVKAVVSLRE